ncbi:MAG: Chemotaxis protein CheY [Fibrobacteres bacterium]|nr:Chemotaxis protein CheY [Fibrobacterota bacterium]
MKILLVDDSNTMRRIEKNTLEKMGYTDIQEAVDGADAISKLTAGGFELVLMDWNMPNMTGIEALKVIKANPATKGVPVIMVTSESEKTRIMEAIQAGAANYVVKPFQAETLQEKISAVTKKAA